VKRGPREKQSGEVAKNDGVNRKIRQKKKKLPRERGSKINNRARLIAQSGNCPKDFWARAFRSRERKDSRTEKFPVSYALTHGFKGKGRGNLHRAKVKGIWERGLGRRLRRRRHLSRKRKGVLREQGNKKPGEENEIWV